VAGRLIEPVPAPAPAPSRLGEAIGGGGVDARPSRAGRPSCALSLSGQDYDDARVNAIEPLDLLRPRH
jgi:hypothetical protein